MDNKPSTDGFQWNEQMAKDLCEYVGLRVGKGTDIKQQIELLTQDFKAQASSGGKDWEVLEYVDRRMITDIPDLDIVRPNDDRWRDAVIYNYPIRSIRRLSDREVFNVGDEIESVNKFIGKFGKIEAFHVSGGGGLVVVADRGLWLQEIRKAPIPEPKFNWVVFTNDGFGFDAWSAKDWRGDKGTNWDESVKTFLTKSETDEYILLNKPVLSVKDICGITAKYGVNAVNIEKEVQQLAKSKINKEGGN